MTNLDELLKDHEAEIRAKLEAAELAVEVERPRVKTVLLHHDGEDLALVVDPRLLDDWRFSMLITRVEKDPSLIEDVMVRMLGESQYERMLTFFEDADGFVPASLVSGALEKLMRGVAPNS